MMSNNVMAQRMKAHVLLAFKYPTGAADAIALML
jgi:hypothetical protein